ncbi:hypothetical protein HCN44_010712 [Aphidius gifuensis]|uniref:V-SNARE coiled-coil homology domain-containing protein n=1 Tax=Aphidius gifuensis TaxID=684658 RepID=A0A834XTG8_APHGI|nr:uncharacterized protein LOC122855817 [Aphidius gifuensis]KAF7991911.1 hypothetical protein HCN44_010712 [Aphidius gifuensis]
MNMKILYTTVLHWERSDYKIVASYPLLDVSVYRDVVLGAIKDFKPVEDEKISITCDKYIVHILAEELHYACLTLAQESPIEESETASWAHEYLEKVQTIYRELPILADLSRDLTHISSDDLSNPLKKMMENSCNGTKNLPAIWNDLAEARTVLLESVQKLIDRGQRLDDLLKKTQTLEIKVRKDFRLKSRSSEKKNKNLFITVFTTILMLILTITFIVLLYIEIYR